MAEKVPYKQYTRNQRRSVLETDFSKGMMSSQGLVDEGYLKSLVNFTYEKETSAIIPRPGLRLSTTIFPNLESEFDEDFLDEDIVIKDSKQCIENGTTYNQIILGVSDDEDPTKGRIWVLTSTVFLDQTPFVLDEDYVSTVTFANYVVSGGPHVCRYYTAESPSIHDIYLTKDKYKRIEFPVGTFAYGNSYYFFGEDSEHNPGLFHTVFDDTQNPPRYVFEKVEPKVPSVTEAVAYGYNMLRNADAYIFNDEHAAQVPQLQGILPYDPYTNVLMMTPKQNQLVTFRCYYDIASSQSYDVVWEWRETTSADWTLIQKSNVTFSLDTELTCQFQPPAKDLMIRVVLYTPGTEDVVEAIVVGFDFSQETFGAARNLEQKTYDLTTSSGMEAWNGRIVLWGIPSDPTILFISDYNEPAYMPYPNNIVVFDEPIIYAVEFLDSLVVFTTDKIYQVTTEDGNTWTSKVLQSHLSINTWDKHLIQVVRNMLYFKSGNYYYMMVPKAQSLTGELTLAPITTPITSFFDRFSVNVEELLRYTYGYTGDYELLTYYNFLDYEDIHNIYAYTFDDSRAILHFDVIYNTMDRTWKVWVYESPSLIYPFKQDATRTGLLASTSLVNFENSEQGYEISSNRIIQLFVWDKMLVKSCYLPNHTKLLYNPTGMSTDINEYCLNINPEFADIHDHGLYFLSDLVADIHDLGLFLLDASDFYFGYSKNNVLTSVAEVYDRQDDYYTFKNFQFIDTGYRNDEVHYKKRYREIQLQLNNLDKKNMQFGMDYVLDGAPRGIFYKYDVTQIIDELDPDYGVVYIDSTPYMETEINNLDRMNQWCLDQDLTPEVALWKVRIAVSGKGYAPRLRLYSRNQKRFELLGMNWVAKLMNLR